MLLKSKKKGLAQSTAEYAILLSLVVAAALAMQHEVRRALQARMHDAAEDFINESGGSTFQYEPQMGNKNRSTTADQTITEEYVDSSNQIEFYRKDGNSQTDFDSNITN